MSGRLVTLLMLLTVLVVATFCIRILDERQQAFRTLLNDPDPRIAGVGLNVPVLTEPGWYLSIPVLHQFYVYPRQLLVYEVEPDVPALTEDKIPLEIDYYAMWRITDPARFYEKVKSVPSAQRPLESITYDKVKRVLALHRLDELLSEKRRGIMRAIADSSQVELGALGIELVDLQIRRTEYPEANLDGVFQRMRADREAVAKKTRAEGEKKARTVRSDAERESERIRADARRRVAELRGEGDANAARIFADAFTQDPEFYSFFRSLNAYRASLDAETTLILSPTLPFLKYFFSDSRRPTP